MTLRLLPVLLLAVPLLVPTHDVPNFSTEPLTLEVVLPEDVPGPSPHVFARTLDGQRLLETAILGLRSQHPWVRSTNLTILREEDPARAVGYALLLLRDPDDGVSARAVTIACARAETDALVRQTLAQLHRDALRNPEARRQTLGALSWCGVAPLALGGPSCRFEIGDDAQERGIDLVARAALAEYVPGERRARVRDGFVEGCRGERAPVSPLPERFGTLGGYVDVAGATLPDGRSIHRLATAMKHLGSGEPVRTGDSTRDGVLVDGFLVVSRYEQTPPAIVVDAMTPWHAVLALHFPDYVHSFGDGSLFADAVVNGDRDDRADYRLGQSLWWIRGSSIERLGDIWTSGYRLGSIYARHGACAWDGRLTTDVAYEADRIRLARTVRWDRRTALNEACTDMPPTTTRTEQVLRVVGGRLVAEGDTRVDPLASGPGDR